MLAGFHWGSDGVLVRCSWFSYGILAFGLRVYCWVPILFLTGSCEVRLVFLWESFGVPVGLYGLRVGCLSELLLESLIFPFVF